MKYQVLCYKTNSRLHEILKSEGGSIIICDSTLDLQRSTQEATLFAIILDVSSHDEEAQQNMIAKIRKQTFAPLLVISDPAHICDSLLHAGADVCLSAEICPEQIAAQAMALVRRKNYYDMITADAVSVITCGELVVDPVRHRVYLAGKELKLQNREFKLLTHFVRNPGIVLTPEKICETVWVTDHDYNRDVSPIISELRRKLGDNAKDQHFIETVHGVGYRFTRDFVLSNGLQADT